jgi:exonuclease SbcC
MADRRSGWVERTVERLLSKQNEIVQKEAAQETATTALELAAKSLEDCQKQSGIRKQELEDALKHLQQGKDALSQLLGDRLLREYRTEKETLLREMAFLTKIADLKITGQNWEDGKPCPLCGATNTPRGRECPLSPMKPNGRSIPWPS